MRFSRSLIIRIIIFAVICVIFVGLLPTIVQVHLEGKASERGIDTFNFYATISDSIFNEFSVETIPKSIEGFDFDTLKELGNKINVDFDETIELTKKPFGSQWISHALGLTVRNLVKQLAESIINTKISTILYSTILSFVGILISIILFILFFPSKFIKKEMLLNDWIMISWQAIVISRLNIIMLALLLGILSYVIVISIPMSVKLILYPPIANFGQIYFGLTFYFTTFVFLFGAISLIFLLIKYFKTRRTGFRRFFFLILIIPVIALGYNLWSSTRYVESVNIVINSQNISSNRQMVIQDCCKIAYSTRQWYCTNHKESSLKLEELTFPDDALLSVNENGKYNFEIEGDLLTITGEGKYELENGTYPLSITTYNAERDSIRTRLIQ